MRKVQVEASKGAPLDPELVLAPSYVAVRPSPYAQSDSVSSGIVNLGVVSAAALADKEAGLPAGAPGGALDRVVRTDRTLVLGGRTAAADSALGADGLPIKTKRARRLVVEPVLGTVEPLFPGTSLPQRSPRGVQRPSWHSLLANLPVFEHPGSLRSFLYVEAANACVEQLVAGNGTEELLPNLRLSTRPRLIVTLHPTPRIDGVAHSSLIVDDDPWRRPKRHTTLPHSEKPPNDEVEEYELLA